MPRALTESEARQLLPVLKRDITQADVRCPAGSACGGNGVVCGIEGKLIAAPESPTSLDEFCLSKYTTCPSWRAERESLWKRRKGVLES